MHVGIHAYITEKAERAAVGWSDDPSFERSTGRDGKRAIEQRHRAGHGGIMKSGDGLGSSWSPWLSSTPPLVCVRVRSCGRNTTENVCVYIADGGAH